MGLLHGKKTLGATALIVVVAVVAGLGSGGSDAAARPGAGFVLAAAGGAEYMLTFDQGVSEAEARAQAVGAGLETGRWIAQLHTLEVRPAAGARVTARSAEHIASLPHVERLEPNRTVHITDVPNDPDYAVEQWAPQLIGAETAWDTSTGSSTVVVAVVDSGVDAAHPEFAGQLTAGYDFVYDDADPQDDNGHGTHVAGIVGALTDNGTGIASVGRDTSIMPVKVINQYGAGNHATTAAGITWAVDNGAHIINLSLGDTGTSQTLEDAVNYAYDAGVLVVASAGNSGSATPFYPAAYDNAMAVAATDATDARWVDSNHGPWISMAAPGVDIYSTNWGGAGAYHTRSGTSQAAPHVAGVGALMLAVDPSLSAAELRDKLQSTALDLGTVGHDHDYGYGRLDAAAAVDSAMGTSSATDPTATPTTEATATPTVEPTATPTTEPTATPTSGPTATPTTEPTATPTTAPTATPTPTDVASGPVITDVRADPVRPRWADIKWTTDVPATSQVEWGLTDAYGNLSALNTTEVTAHDVRLEGLERRTTYHYRVRSEANGIETISADYTFRTR